MEPDDLEWHLQILTSPLDDEAHRRERERSVQYLLAHADAAHRRILEAVSANPDGLDVPALIEVLSRFDRPESVPVLEALLFGRRERTVSAAGEALGRRPGSDARDALFRGLSSAETRTINAAADGLMLRGDPEACPKLLALRTHPDPNTRYHVVRAADALRCLSRETLSDLERHEGDPDVRRLIHTILERRR